MESFRWDSCFVTGLVTVDDQHRRLVDVINAFGELLIQPQGPTALQIEEVLNELADYAHYHFTEEEALMERSRLSASHIDQHRAEHESFLRDVVRMRADLSGQDREAAMRLLEFLINWLAYHILGVDQSMARQIAAIEAGAAPEDRVAGPKHRDPATATLLHSLERLFLQVSERNRALFELNQTLEARVAERTRELSEANQRLEDMALTDALTALPNRRHAMRRLQAEWREWLDRGTPLACIVLDADGFKPINDTFGHDAGDEVLRQLALRLRDAVRTDDAVCRMGGDEFLVICGRTALEGAMQIAEKLRHDVGELRVAAGRGEWRGSISAGVGACAPWMKNVEALLKAADDGLYAAKRNGRNCVMSSGQAPHAG